MEQTKLSLVDRIIYEPAPADDFQVFGFNTKTITNSIIARKRERLSKNLGIMELEGLANLPDIELITKVYNDVSLGKSRHTAKYPESFGIGYFPSHTYSSMTRNLYIPLGLRFPKTTIGLQIFLWLTNLSLFLLVLSEQPEYWRLWFVYGLYTLICLAGTSVAITNYRKGMTMVKTLREDLQAQRDTLEDKLDRFENKLKSSGRVFFSQVLKEARIQRSLHSARLEELTTKLKSCVTAPRTKIGKRIVKTIAQLQGLDRVSRTAGDEYAQEIRLKLTEKVESLNDSLKGLSPLEEEVLVLIEESEQTLAEMDRKIATLVRRRVELSTDSDYMLGIHYNLGSELDPTKWGYLESRKYYQELTELLNDFKELNESMRQINSMTDEAIKMLPEAPRLALVA